MRSPETGTRPTQPHVCQGNLIGKAVGAVCPSGVMALKLIRCLGHDAEQKQEEASDGMWTYSLMNLLAYHSAILSSQVVTLEGDAEELLQWTSNPDVPALLHNAWPIWGLLALLTEQRKHSFIITARDAPREKLSMHAPLLDFMWDRQESEDYPLGVVWISTIPRRTSSSELSTWLSRLRNALLTRRQPYAEHQVLLVTLGT